MKPLPLEEEAAEEEEEAIPEEKPVKAEKKRVYFRGNSVRGVYERH